MQLQLKQTELETAVREYIVNMGISRPVGKVKFTATRGNEGILTEVELDELGGAAKVAIVPPTPKAEKSATKKADKKAAPKLEPETPAKEEANDPPAENGGGVASATLDLGKSLFG